MKHPPDDKNDCRTSYLALFDLFNKAGIPPEPRWRSLLLFFREVKDYDYLTDTQKIAVQGLLADILKGGDYSEKRLKEVLQEYYGIQIKPYKEQIDCLVREAADIVGGFRKLLSNRKGTFDTLEEESVSIMAESESGEEAIAKLRLAFRRVKKLLEADIKTLEKIAEVDDITSITNRRGFDQFMRTAISAWLIAGRPLYLAMLDIDHFKRFNDKYGHRTGDQVLAVVGSHLKKAMEKFNPSNDVLAARYGGEEFALAVSGPDAALLPEATKKCCNRIREFNLLIRDADGNIVESGLCISVSAGVTTMGKRWQSAHLENLIDSADRALYNAKNSGRDATVEFRPDKKESFIVISVPG